MIMLASLSVCKRFLSQILKEKFSFLIMVFLPGIMLLGFWMAFSTTGEMATTTYDLIVINNDQGLSEGAKATLQMYPNISDQTIENGFGYDFIQILNNTKYPESNTSIFSVDGDYTNLTKAKREIESRTYDAIVVFPENYSNVTLSAINNVNFIKTGIYIPSFPQNENGTIEIIGDEDYLNFQISDMILKQFFSQFEESITSLGYSGGKISMNLESVQLGKELSVFDQIVPGLMVMAIVMQSGIISAILTSETASPNRTIERLRISLLKPSEYLTGVILAQIVIVPMQLVFLFALTIPLGFQHRGSFIDAFFVLWITSIFSLGLLFLGAAIFKTGEATGQALGFLSMPITFASGAFVSTPNLVLWKDIFPTPSGQLRDFLLWDLLPTTHAVNASRAILLGNYSLLEVLVDVLTSVGLSLVLITLGMYFYIKKRYLGDLAA